MASIDGARVPMTTELTNPPQVSEPIPTPAPVSAAGNDIERALRTEANRRRKTRFLSIWAIRLALIVLVLGLWVFLVEVGVLNPLFVGSPDGTAAAVYEMVASGRVWSPLFATAGAAFAGLAIGSVIGILGAALLSWFPKVNAAIAPILTVFNSMPRPALAPIFLLWFGLGPGPKVLVAASLVVFILFLNTQAGLARLNPDIEMLMNTLGLSRWRQFITVRLPAAIPSIVAGFRLSAVYSVLGVVVTEMVAANTGLGQLLVLETGRFNVNAAFGVIVVLAALTTLLDSAISIFQRWLERRMGYSDRQ